MKLRQLLCMAVMMIVLSSCKNENVKISREVVFNVNPYTIVVDFSKYEVNVGDIVTFKYDDHPEYYRLRTYLLIYNAEGDLVMSKTEDLKNYNERMTASFELPDGSYTAVSLAHVYNDKEACAYWFVKDMDQLDALNVVNNDDCYNTWVKAIGIKKMNIEVGSGFKSCDMDLRPMVALMINYIRNIHYYFNCKGYQPFINKRPTKITFDYQGECKAIFDECATPDYPLLSPYWTEDISGEDVYCYCFFTPLQTAAFEWRGIADDDAVYTLGGARSANIQAGKVFNSTIDLRAGVFDIRELTNGKAEQTPPKDAVKLHAIGKHKINNNIKTR